MNPYMIEDTLTLLEAIDKAEVPGNFLSELFFKRSQVVNTDLVTVETRRARRELAPAIVKNARGVDVARVGATAKWYSPVTFAPRRTISLADVSRRLFGEIPNLYSSETPEERAAKLQSEDLIELERLHFNRREQLVSEMLQSGKVSLKAYADDGELAQVDTIDYGWSNLKSANWDTSSAKIYDDLLIASSEIQAKAGVVPTVAVCGKNIERKLLSNKEIMNWLMIPNRQNLAIADLEPHFTNPEVRFIGRIGALNLELYSYAKTYVDEGGVVKPFVGDDNVIIGVPDIGRICYAPVTIFDAGGFRTIAAPLIPKYTSDEASQTISLTMYSRCVVVPDDVELWACIKTA